MLLVTGCLEYIRFPGNPMHNLDGLCLGCYYNRSSGGVPSVVFLKVIDKMVRSWAGRIS